ncbi:cytochrome like [Capsicum chacoense]
MLLSSIALVCVLGLFFHLYNSLITKPRKLQLALRKQGIIGPHPKFLLGNILEMKKSREAAAKIVSNNGDFIDSHNCGATLLPFFDQWQRKYGDVFMFSLGNTQIVHVTQPEMVREITTCTSLDLGKPTYQARERGSLLGNGILTSNGPFWAHQRKILAPELYMEKVKGMINLVQDSALTLLSSWNDQIEAEGGIADIKIDPYMRSFSGDVISKACFGSNFSKGKKIFFKLRALQQASSKTVLSTGIPGARYIPSKNNREIWGLEKEIKALILKIVKEKRREEASATSENKDLLQMVLEGATIEMTTQNAIDTFIVDNCKNIYLAGYETTAVAATWCLMLLAANPIWQQHVRDEVMQICKGHEAPDADMIRQMKQLTMVINESLRLYPPVAVISREALKDMKFGEINVPKSVNIWTLVTTLHTDPKIWGTDSYKFNPERFANGIRGACKFPQVYMPFGVGPRVCLGQNLAMVELKILISLILTKFSFTISSKYVHSPALNLVIEPGHGVYLSLRKL